VPAVRPLHGATELVPPCGAVSGVVPGDTLIVFKRWPSAAPTTLVTEGPRVRIPD
jgi:hypothetical protein